MSHTTVEVIYFDFRITLQFGQGSSVIVESPFTIHGLSGQLETVHPESVVNPAAVLAALHQKAVDITITDSSELIVRLENATWVIPADENYESWHLLHEGMNLTCSPGGLW